MAYVTQLTESVTDRYLTSVLHVPWISKLGDESSNEWAVWVCTMDVIDILNWVSTLKIWPYAFEWGSVIM